MVKRFIPVKRNSSVNKIFSAKTKTNSCLIFLPQGVDCIRQKPTFPDKRTANAEATENLQIFYGLCRYTFGTHLNLKNCKNSFVLKDFNFKKAILLPKNHKVNSTLRPLNLLRLYNHSLLLTGYLHACGLANSPLYVDTKILIRFIRSTKTTFTFAQKSNLRIWNRRRRFRKIQIVSGLTTNFSLFSHKLLTIWLPYKKLSFGYGSIKENQYFYYLRRFLDKSVAKEFVSSQNNISENLIALLHTHKAQFYRLLRLKKVLRKPLRRRASRWSLLPRDYVKEKYQERFPDESSPLILENNINDLK